MGIKGTKKKAPYVKTVVRCCLMISKPHARGRMKTNYLLSCDSEGKLDCKYMYDWVFNTISGVISYHHAWDKPRYCVHRRINENRAGFHSIKCIQNANN
jgi:hypothetical protein